MHKKQADGMIRRDFLKNAAAAAATALSSCRPGLDGHRPGLILEENRKPGTRNWQLTRVRLDRASGGIRSRWIEGYCSRQSVQAGETLQILVSADPPRRFVLEIFRMGYYGGAGARLMTTLGPFQGRVQPDPPVGGNADRYLPEGEDRLRECRWEPATEITIPEDWVSGVYLGRLTLIPESRLEAAWQSYTIFIVRDNRPADILFQCADNTWQAYNKWPDDYSLYTDPRGAHAPGVDVSFDRPYGKFPMIFENPQSVGSGEFLLWEYPLCCWLERHGYDVTYCSNSDLLDPSRAARCKTFISPGHDEYWDLRQYESAMTAIQNGTSAQFLTGNAVFMMTPFQPSTDGRPNRIITRVGRYGGVSEKEKEVYGHMMGPFPVDGPDEALLMGARSIVPFNGGGDWIAVKPEHWIFEGTGMKEGDAIPGLVGWEFHGDPADIAGLEVVAEGIALRGGVDPAHWTATVYPGPKGNFVFNASTIWWAQGLSSPPGHTLPWSHWTRPLGPDERVQKITHNVLQRAVL